MGNLKFRPFLEITLIWLVDLPMLRHSTSEAAPTKWNGGRHAPLGGHRWALKLLPALNKGFRLRKRPVGKSWRMDEPYILVRGQWKYLYRAVDKAGHTIDFLLRAQRDKAAARRFFEKAIAHHGQPDSATIAAIRPTWRPCTTSTPNGKLPSPSGRSNI
ncbi:Mobile element protein (plasmid) [Cupriavidus necator H850]|nr:Mobile element protein [Cupriavidus necator H850]